MHLTESLLNLQIDKFSGNFPFTETVFHANKKSYEQWSSQKHSQGHKF